MPQPVDTEDYEKNRINQLQEQFTELQKKTFTKWMNSFLSKAKMEVNDIFVDLADGRKLLKLLEIISGEQLGRSAIGQMRLHKVETINRCLNFLKEQNVKIGNIGAEDIVDGNQKLILGLIWSIILRFHIKDIEVDSTSDSETTDEADIEQKKVEQAKPKHSTKEALILWCQKRTRGYAHVDVRDMTSSFRNGMAFNALIHSHDPQLVDYDSLNPEEHIDNLNNAFTVARDHLNIEPLLDAEDVDTEKSDEQSILTYVSSFYHTIANDGFNSTVVKIPAAVVEEQIETKSADDVDAAKVNSVGQYDLSTTPAIVQPSTKANSESNGAALPVAEQGQEEGANTVFLWVIVVAVGFTILRSIFRNTTDWFMGDQGDTLEPSL